MIFIKRLISLVLALILVFAFSVSSFASITADIQANDLASGWGSGSSLSYPTGYLTSWYYRVLYWLSQIRSNSDSIISSLGTKTSSQSNIITCLNSIMSRTAGTIGEFYYLDDKGNSTATADFFQSVGNNLFKLNTNFEAFLYWTLIDQQVRDFSSSNQESFITHFLSADSSSSVKTSDISDLSSIGTSFNNTFSTGTSSSGVFDVLNSNDPWEWFTNDVANSLLADSISSASTFSFRSAPVENDVVITSYYEDNLSDFYSWLDLVGDTE